MFREDLTESSIRESPDMARLTASVWRWLRFFGIPAMNVSASRRYIVSSLGVSALMIDVAMLPAVSRIAVNERNAASGRFVI